MQECKNKYRKIIKNTLIMVANFLHEGLKMSSNSYMKLNVRLVKRFSGINNNLLNSPYSYKPFLLKVISNECVKGVTTGNES